MNSQIIISREDNTDFLTLGHIQTDSSLVSALGGALASFAEEIGLTVPEEKAADSSMPENENVNLSRFQNGILASKVVAVGDHRPIILIAIKGFDGKDEDVNFIIDFASEIAQEIVQKFQEKYTSIGEIPQLENTLPIIIDVAHQCYRDDADKVRFFTKNFKPKINKLLKNIWENQIDLVKWLDSEGIADKTDTDQIKNALVKYFYREGVKTDAFFPLFFSPESDPYKEIGKIIDKFFSLKAKTAHKEFITDIRRIIFQLRDSSRALSKRGSIEIADVEILNESVIFEKLFVAKNEDLPTKSKELVSLIVQEIYQKLSQKNPLKIIAMAKEHKFTLAETQRVIKKSLEEALQQELGQKEWFEEQIASLLQEIIGKYPPEEVIDKYEEIIDQVIFEFRESVKKIHPLLVLADPTFEALNPVVTTQAQKAFERFKTSYDEAVVLYNVIGQIHSLINSDKSSEISDLMILYFLQSVIQPYQFREVTEIVYTLVAECLENTSYAKKRKPKGILETSIKRFEKNLNFKIVADTKDLVLQRILEAKPTLQKFENFENLEFFFKSFRTALENTLKQILQRLFGPETFPSVPSLITESIDTLVTQVQGVYFIARIIEQLKKRPGGRELFSQSAAQFFEKNTDFKCILPKASDLAVKAYNAGWLKPSNNKKKAKITGKEFLKTKVSVPELAREGIVKELIADPEIFSVLWKKYASTIIKEREKEVEETIRFYEDKMKVSAGKTEGKKKYGQILKSMKRFSRSLDNLISGGGFLRRLFRGKKEIKQVIHEANVAAFPGFSYHPKNFTIDSKKMFLKSKSRSQMNAVIGDFQQLITIYASIWITESKYIDYLEDKLFWKGVMQQNGERNTHDPLEKRILSNLKTTSKKKSRLNQKQIIRRSIEEAIVPVFNENIRFLLDESFAIFTDDQLVKYDSKKKEWYIPILTLDLPKSCVKRVFTSLPNVVVKKKNEQTEIRFLLADFESSMKAKDAQTIETFLRCSVFQTLNKEEFKALDFFGELNERYIGKSTANRFFSNIKHLAQMILSPSK